MRRLPGTPCTCWIHAAFVLFAALAAASPRIDPLPATAARDTVTLLGGPLRWDGRFENAAGDADWNGWTRHDYSVTGDTLWQVSTFNAEALGGHGSGNHAMWCGADLGGQLGYGNDWNSALDWTWTVADPGSATEVVVQGRLNHDTEPGFDRLHLRVYRVDGWHDLAVYEGWRTDRAVDVATVLAPGDYAGDAGNEIRLRWAFESDEMWSDADGLYPTDGACQLDDLTVLLAGEVVTFDDFEPGHPAAWTPAIPKVGDFAHLASGLLDLDSCLDNSSWQVCFVDDGIVVPGTGGSPCTQWCYGPGGYVLNSSGGLLGSPGHLDNGVVSPALAWPQGCHQAQVAFDVWRHEPFLDGSPGMLYRWRVRSTASVDPQALADAEWVDRGERYFGSPGYVRHHEIIGDLLEPGRRWIQVELGVYEAGWLWGFSNGEATPAPYFDNVAVQAWPVDRPAIVVRPGDLPQDTFPAAGRLDFTNLANNACRFDMARNISPLGHHRNDPGDSVVICAATLRDGAILLGSPMLTARVHCNPLFNPYRIMPPPGGSGFIQTSASGDSCRLANGRAIRNRWAFDLLDERFLFPGDVVHFFFESIDLANGQVGFATWPADTTGFSDFGPGSTYPLEATMRALPSVFNSSGDQAPVLLWQDFATGDNPAAWSLALGNIGLHPGVDYDRFVTRDPDGGLGNGIGGRCSPELLAGYKTLLYAAGDHVRAPLSTGDERIDPSADIPLLNLWLTREQGRLLVTGDNVPTSLFSAGGASQTFATSKLGLNAIGSDATPLIGGQVSPRVLRIPGNPVFTSLAGWRAVGSCPARRQFDAILPIGGAARLAEFANRNGVGGAYQLAAAVLLDNAIYDFRTITLPMALSAIANDSGDGGGALPVPNRALVLKDILTYFGAGFGAPIGVPPAAELAVRSFPNPFNPMTTIAYDLPAAGRTTLKIYDLRGRLVKVLLDRELPAGSGTVTWDGTDGNGAAVASGVYFHELSAGGEIRLGKMTVVR